MVAHNIWIFRLWDNPTCFIFDPLICIHSLVTCKGFEAIILIVIAQCTIVCDLSVIELEHNISFKKIATNFQLHVTHVANFCFSCIRQIVSDIQLHATYCTYNMYFSSIHICTSCIYN